MRKFTAVEVVERAKSLIGKRIDPPMGVVSIPKPVLYRLTERNGGTDPFQKHCGSWSPDINRWTSDCTGFVCWCLGLDRYQPPEWINTDSAIRDAKNGKIRFTEISVPELGCAVVFGSVWRNGIRTKVGHWGIVTGVPAEWESSWELLKVTHCSSGVSRKTGSAISETSGEVWRNRGMFLRYVNTTSVGAS